MNSRLVLDGLALEGFEFEELEELGKLEFVELELEELGWSVFEGLEFGLDCGLTELLFVPGCTGGKGTQFTQGDEGKSCRKSTSNVLANSIHFA